MRKHWINTTKITFSGVYLALIVGLQVALSPFPNVETVTLLLIVAAVNLPLLMVLTLNCGFVLLELLVYGFGTWFFLYLVIWPLLILGSVLLRPLIKRYWCISAVWGSVFGFAFGTIDALLKGLLFGPSGLLAYWIQGLLFDLVHGISNFLVIFCCYLPVAKIVKLYARHFSALSPSRPYLYQWIIFNWSQSKQKVVEQWNRIIMN